MKSVNFRQQALELVNDFTDIWVQSGYGPVDYYKLLWVTHWAVENFGIDRVRQLFIDVITKPGARTEDPAERLRLMMVNARDNIDNIGEWFERAMKS